MNSLINIETNNIESYENIKKIASEALRSKWWMYLTLSTSFLISWKRSI